VAALYSYLNAENRLDAPLTGETRVGPVHLHGQNVRAAVNLVQWFVKVV